MNRRLRQGGFSLLEVLVAFAILSVSLGVLLQVFAGGLRNAGVSGDYTQAALYAESILAAIGREAPLSEGVHSGPIDDRFSWRSTVDAYTEGMPVSENMPVHGYRVRVEVFWRGLAQARSVQLETLRLELPDPSGQGRR